MPTSTKITSGATSYHKKKDISLKQLEEKCKDPFTAFSFERNTDVLGHYRQIPNNDQK
jgi:hypothetical protein